MAWTPNYFWSIWILCPKCMHSCHIAPILYKCPLSHKSGQLHLKTGCFGPPPWFWNDSYWSRGFWNDRSRLLIGRELALDLAIVQNFCKIMFWRQNAPYWPVFFQSSSQKSRVKYNICLWETEVIFDYFNFWPSLDILATAQNRHVGPPHSPSHIWKILASKWYKNWTCTMYKLCRDLQSCTNFIKLMQDNLSCEKLSSLCKIVK